MTTETVTALIKVNPESDTSVLSLLCEANKLRDYALARVIASDADLSPATEDLSLIAKLKKSLTEKKAEYYKPIKTHLDAVSAAFQSLLTPVEEADKITREKIMAYRTEQKRKADEAAAINQAKLDLARREAALNGGEITVDLTPVEAPAPVHKVQTDLGTASTMKVLKWELVDFAAVPDQYKMIDAAKVTKIVKVGGTIPGIRTWEEETLRITAK